MREVKLIDLIEEKISGEWGNDPVSANAVNIIRTTNFTNGGTIDYRNIVKREIEKRHIDNKRLKYGDIIIEKSGGSPTQPVGRVVFFDKQDHEGIFLCNNFTTVLRPKKDISPRFFFHVFFNKHLLKDTLKYQNQTTGIINLKLDTYLNSESVKVPSDIEKQIQIAFVLDTAEQVRRARYWNLIALNYLQQAVFLEMFGNPAINPKNWAKVKVGSVTDCIVPGRDKPKNFTGKTAWVTTDDLERLGWTSISKKGLGLSDDEITEVRAKVIPKESVIMTCVGQLGVITIAEEEMVINQQLHAFQCSDKINNVFLAHNLSYETDYMFKMASSTTVPYMNKTVCNSIPVLLPPIDLQIKFADIAKEVYKLKKIFQEYLKEAENLQKSLFQKAFDGTLEIDKKAWKRLDTEGWIKNYIETGSPTPKPTEPEFIPLPLHNFTITTDGKATEYSNIGNMMTDVKNYATQAFGQKGYFTFEELEKMLFEKTQQRFAYSDLKDYIFRELDRTEAWFEQDFLLHEDRDKSKGIDESRIVFRIKEQTPPQ